MARRVKIEKPLTTEFDSNFRGLYDVLNSFNLKSVLVEMINDGSLTDWDSRSKEASLKGRMTNEKDLYRKAVYCAVLSNFEDEPVEEEPVVE